MDAKGLVAQLPQAIVKRYERLRKGLVNAVAIVDAGTCTACRMHLPPQLFINLQRADEIHQCRTAAG